MGVDTRRPPLPAATDSGIDGEHVASSDLDTDLSRATDRTHYSIPEDGSPLVVAVPHKNVSSNKNLTTSRSQASLLIEYFEATKGADGTSARPSVRVRVSPRSKKSTGLAPTHSQTVPLPPVGRSAITEATRPSDADFESNLYTGDLASNLSGAGKFIPAASDISSMPGDSMLDEPFTLKAPAKPDPRGLEAVDAVKLKAGDTLRTPSQRQRSLSRERITQRVIEKVGQESERRRSSKNKDTALTASNLEGELLSHRRRSSKSAGDSDRISATDSSLLSPRGHGSNISGISKSSINNPKLLATVEDAIRRLILPEIETLKREQSIHYNREKFDRSSKGLRDSRTTADYLSRDDSTRRLSKATSEPRLKPKIVLDRDGGESGVTLSSESTRHRKVRRSSRDSSGRRDSLDSDHADDKSYRRKAKARDAAAGALVGSALTAAALKKHDSTSSKELRKSEDKHRRRSDRSSNSIADTEGDEYIRQEIPPMPMRSAMQSSDLTRESILSADHERPASRESYTPVRQVGRSSPRVITPSRSREGSKTPSSTQRKAIPRDHRPSSVSALYSPRSTQSLSSAKAKETALGTTAAMAGLVAVGAAGTKYLSDKENRPSTSPRDVSGDKQRDAVSPVQSAASYQDNSPTANRQSTFTSHGKVSLPSPGDDYTYSPGDVSRDISARNSRVTADDMSDDDIGRAKQAAMDDWYEQQHRVNDQYRRSMDYDNQLDSAALNDPRISQYTDKNGDVSGQAVKGIGANPQYIDSPVPVESVVASLHEPSMVSSRSGHPGISDRSFLDSPGEGSPAGYDRNITALYDEQNNRSAERWKAINNQAKNISVPDYRHPQQFEPSPRQSIAQSVESEKPEMRASAVPLAGDPLPDFAADADEITDLTTNPSVKDKDSIVEEQLGDPYENRDHWPTAETPSNKRIGFVSAQDRDSGGFIPGEAAMAAAATGLGLGAIGTMHRRPNETAQSATRDVPQDFGAAQYGKNVYEGTAYDNTPATMKDEGYISAQSPRVRPKLMSYDQPPQLFDDADVDDEPEVGQEDDPFVTNKRAKYLSGNSHGMASPLFDAATGKGMNNIQSKDVVALMDHLTVRDGQRSARDTEILVTLVRSAAEMRNSFDEIKKQLDQQTRMNNAKRADVGPDRGAQRNLVGNRTTVSPRMTPRANSTVETVPGKKKNIFQRALKGLGSRSSDDLARIEDMLNHLLYEVEDLKAAQGVGTQAFHADSVQDAPLEGINALDSYERLRAAPESGYEPEGQAGTGSTPNQSRYSVASQQSRQTPRRSGLRQDNRVSTVIEGDEDELEEHENYVLDQFENSERLLTPTQEARRQMQQANETTPRAHAPRVSIDATPRTGERSSKHKSTGSSGFGLPKISRWSKTTTSTTFDNRSSIQNEKAYPGSQSGSEVNLVDGNGPYMRNADDRLRSANSFTRNNGQGEGDQRRSSSPLIPDTAFIDDPKYQANRHSLILEHPQPRQGPTPRHQSHLETQAYEYNTPRSPDSDTFGSMPSLARFSGGYANHRLSSGGGNLSPISSEGSYATNSNNYAPPRPPKIREEGPLVPSAVPPAPTVPPKVPNVQEPPSTSLVRPADRRPHEHDEDRELGIDGDSGGSIPSWDRSDEMDDMDQDAYGDIDQHDIGLAHWQPETISIPRKKSPYSPGGPLAPIVERYSMELDRASTPGLAPRPAIGAEHLGGSAGGEIRKLTGPREMPVAVSGPGSRR